MVLSEEIKKSSILVVDDSAAELEHIIEILKKEYVVKVANNGATALKIAQSLTPPDLILLDILMPNMNGYEVCEQLKKNRKTAAIPVIYVTTQAKIEDEARGLRAGAVDYVTKPIFPEILMARVQTHLKLKKMQDFLANQNQLLEAEVAKRTAEIMAIQDVTIHALASLAETRDNDTGGHIRRTQHYVKLLAEKLRFHPKFSHFLDDDNTIKILFKSAPLHDIGKVGIPDSILLKPGRLNAEEFEIMKKHTTLGRDAIIQAERELGIEVGFLRYAKEIAYSHHEKWDGSGYPDGLSGLDIPISARLMAIADVYDALISHRIYKDSMSHEKAVEIIIENAQGKHFDPDIVAAFIECHEKFREISLQFANDETKDSLLSEQF